MNKIIELHFKISQYRAIWFPFQFLKPKIDQNISHKRVLFMSICFGSYFMLATTLKYIISYHHLPHIQYCVLSWLKGIGVFFLWFEIVTRPLWNAYINQSINR